MIMTRCGIDAGKYYAPETFAPLRNFSNVQTLDALGAAVNATANDSLGRLSSMTEYADGVGIQRFRSGYDTSNRATKLEYKVSPNWSGSFGPTRSYGYTYSSNDGTLTAMTLPGGAYSYNYDALKRLTSRTLAVNGSDFMNREFGFLPGTGSDGTTLMVNSLTNKKADGSTLNQYSYSYSSTGRPLSEVP